MSALTHVSRMQRFPVIIRATPEQLEPARATRGTRARCLTCSPQACARTTTPASPDSQPSGIRLARETPSTARTWRLGRIAMDMIALRDQARLDIRRIAIREPPPWLRACLRTSRLSSLRSCVPPDPATFVSAHAWSCAVRRRVGVRSLSRSRCQPAAQVGGICFTQPAPSCCASLADQAP
jgi:hypothetical protein